MTGRAIPETVNPSAVSIADSPQPGPPATAPTISPDARPGNSASSGSHVRRGLATTAAAEHRRQHRSRGERTTELLEHHDELGDRVARTAELLRDVEPEPPLLRESSPVRRDRVGARRRATRAQHAGDVVAFEPPPDGVVECEMFFESSRSACGDPRSRENLGSLHGSDRVRRVVRRRATRRSRRSGSPSRRARPCPRGRRRHR